MMNHFVKLALMVFIFLTSHICLQGQDQARDVFTKAIDQLLSENMELSMEISITDKKGRAKVKAYDILVANFGDVQMTKMSFLKPVEAKGTTVVFTQQPDETGLIEVFTPSNGKIRKLQATPENMKMVGSEAQITSVASQDPDELEFIMLPVQEIAGIRCYTIEVRGKESAGEARGELLIEIDKHRIRQITVYNTEGIKTSFVQLSEFKAVDGYPGKMQPMKIVTEDFESEKLTEMRILKVASRTDLSEKDFMLPESQGI